MREGAIQSLVVVVGLSFEARLAGRIRAQVICSGNGQHLAASLTRAITKQCQGLISLGVAGGLRAELAGRNLRHRLADSGRNPTVVD